MADYTNFINNNVAPYSADRIGVYNSSGTRIGSILLGKFKPDYGERLYRFGFLSDVHNESDLADGNSDDLINALTYFNDKESIEFTVISGDLTLTSYSTNDLATEMAMFLTNKNAVSNRTPVYPTTGNHDCPSSSDINISTFYSYTDAASIAPSSDAEYSYEITKTHTTSDGETVTDHFLFLTMKRYEFSSNTYSSTDITWLGNKLESYKDDRCFVITHMFFPSYAGNFKEIYPSGNWLSGTMLTQLKALIDAYPHSIWFSGHSHWKWYLLKYQDNANVYPTTNVGRTTGWAVHLPSCAYPIDSDGTSTRVTMAGQSEGAIIDVYKDYIDIRAMVFKDADDTTYTNKYIPIAQYRLYTEPTESQDYEFTADLSNWGINSIKGNKDDSITDNISVTQNGSDIITTIHFDAASEGFIFGSSEVTSGDTMTITWDSVTIESPQGTTHNISDVIGIGWYDETDTSESNNYGYTLTSPFTTNTTTTICTGNVDGDTFYGALLNTSSKCSANTSFTITDGVYLNFTNIKFEISGVSGGGDSGDSGDSGETTYKDTLAIKISAKSSGLGINTTNAYVKYDDILVINGTTDVTSTMTSTSSTSNNKFKVGIYNSSQKYQYAAAGTIVLAEINSTGNCLPIAQSSSSYITTTSSIYYIQLKGIKVASSSTATDWTEINESTTLLNGSSWGKTDVGYVWIDDIVDDPSTLTYTS